MSLLAASPEDGLGNAHSHAAADSRAAWQDLALPAGEGLLAFAAGSHAQRDLFEQVHIEALLRSGRGSAAHQLLQTRLNATPASRRLARQLALLDAALGLPAPPAARA
ncbi:MAG: hypothetical protein ABW005_04990 [Burkholderiaceae bacterium]